MRVLRQVVGPIMALTLVAAACGGDDEATPATEGSAAVTSTTAAAPTSAAATTSTSTTTTEAATTTSTSTTTTLPAPDLAAFDDWAWNEIVQEAEWEPRAGLRVVELEGRLFLLGGRTPNQSTIPGDSVIHGDVWVSDDGGATWTELLAEAPWPARAYFQAVVKDGAIYVIGGQDFGLEENPFCALLEQGLEPPPGLGIDPDAPCPEFLPTSRFFNDVWRSTDGVEWEQLTAAAPWAGRAGLSAAVLGDAIFVLAGSQNDDSSIIGPSGPARIYYQDVWRSTDGVDWEPVTEAAPWEPRAGAAAVTRGEHLYLFGGEDGFTCEPLPDCEPPYFNDVWRTADGAQWELVTDAAGWSPRPGHVCELAAGAFVCFGGFGLVENPTDVWVSGDGREWTELASPPWNAIDPEAIKYDFDAHVVTTDTGDVVLTFGGDRETFDFADPENYLRVDNDVWSFSAP